MQSSKILRPFLIILAVALVFVLTFFILTLFIGKKEPQPAIDVTGVEADGQTLYSLSENFGKKGVALVFFELEHRHSQEVLQRIVPKAKELGVEVVAVCVSDGTIQESLARMKELEMPVAEHTLFDLQGEMAKKYNVTAPPCTYFIDKNGMMVDAYLGTISEKSAVAELKEILG